MSKRLAATYLVYSIIALLLVPLGALIGVVWGHVLNRDAKNSASTIALRYVRSGLLVSYIGLVGSIVIFAVLMFLWYLAVPRKA